MTKTPEEKPYLQDLFDHMRNEHDLILTQSEMLEIISVVNQSLTTESVVKENLTSEERADMGIPVSVKNRAKEYAINEWRCFCVEKSEFSRATLMRFCRNDFLAGYHSRNEELTAYREALKVVFDAVDTRFISKEDYLKVKQLLKE